MLSFTPRTEEELRTRHLLPANNYKLKVIKATFKSSQAGNPKIDLTLKEERSSKIIYSNLNCAMEHLVKHFCDSANISALYQAGKLSANDCENKIVYANVGIKPDFRNPTLDVNEIVDYLTHQQFLQAEMPQPKEELKFPGSMTKAAAEFFNDDIPDFS